MMPPKAVVVDHNLTWTKDCHILREVKNFNLKRKEAIRKAQILIRELEGQYFPIQ